MDLKLLVLLFSSFIVTIWAVNPNVAGPMWGPVGCYKDHRGSRKDITLRALRSYYHSYRGNIDWSDLESVIKGCGDNALLKGFDYFAVQFYGECWSDADAANRYNKYGVSTNCWDVGVGKDFTNYVYRKHCGSPDYGCCPDGEKPATGPNNAGCTTGEVCASPDLDIIFIIDDSASMPETDFDKEKDFVKDVIDELSDLNLQVGLIRFGAQSFVEIELDDYTSMTNVKNAIDAVPYDAQLGTYIGYALKKANDLFVGANGMRENSAKVLVLVTDGKDNALDVTSSGYLSSQPPLMEAKGVKIIAVGIGNNVDEAQLQSIASDEDGVYLESGFNSLAEDVEVIANNVCKN